MPKLKCIEVFEMGTGEPAYFTKDKTYLLYSLDNIVFFCVDDQEQLHILPWPEVDEDGFNTKDYFEVVK
jgi:hypothetical protein